ncbi:hypothetical protein LTR28_011361 [Elasticomyces elasticus]|nr:hypothetical protein LTR28_011361 [Elasticomyces elasticus]
MRPLRLVLSLSSSLLAVLLLFYVFVSRPRSHTQTRDGEQHASFWSWRTPSSLFPPSAVISLTDDNSTFFLARPPNFGPLLPTRGLSGQLWIGSGFGGDDLGRGGSVAGSEGELGCSDVPGWSDGEYGSVAKDDTTSSAKARNGKLPSSSSGSRHRNGSKGKRTSSTEDFADQMGQDGERTGHDGTDDHLSYPLPASDSLEIVNERNANKKTADKKTANKKKPAHADIQSLQEGAEIAGKVVLLSRGGCGFLEKVKWVQRRGGTALIVGDDIRGGPLVTMYARGDTSNVTIPSLFTSHTTAHLLSSLIPSGGLIDDLAVEEASRFSLTVDTKASDSSNKQDIDTKPQGGVDKPIFTSTTESVASTATTRSRKKERAAKKSTTNDRRDSPESARGWFSSILRRRGSSDPSDDSRRPPSSGNFDWVLQEDWDEDQDVQPKSTAAKGPSTAKSPQKSTKVPARPSGDDFVIGVQDWRDRDLVADQTKTPGSVPSSPRLISSDTDAASNGGLKGGSITPGSGEYGKPSNDPVDLAPHSRRPYKETSRLNKEKATSQDKGRDGSWFRRLMRLDVGDYDTEHAAHLQPKHDASSGSPSQRNTRHTDPQGDVYPDALDFDRGEGEGFVELHAGLWVTLQPTSLSSSPFFDTLLVLVISPLVTLTIVYALLLLRSRIRRRRWRAPKSVVERLPVRTYQASTTAVSSPTATPALASPVTVTTPLLQVDHLGIAQSRSLPRVRPRSRTASEAVLPQSSSLPPESSLEHVQEKREAGLAEWRRRYGGKQRECVVCLEEYVDGISQVMSLPCGHEFHVECITPWLTTRRRTCPICKGDVVRSLARHSPATASHSSAQQQPHTTTPTPSGSYQAHDHDLHEPIEPLEPEQHDDGPQQQQQGEEARNSSPAAPASRVLVARDEDDLFEDLEQGVSGR